MDSTAAAPEQTGTIEQEWEISVEDELDIQEHNHLWNIETEMRQRTAALTNLEHEQLLRMNEPELLNRYGEGTPNTLQAYKDWFHRVKQSHYFGGSCWGPGEIVSIHGEAFVLLKGILLSERHQARAEPFTVTVCNDFVLTGSVGTNGAEWDWNRIPAALGLGTEKDYLLLTRNQAEFQEAFREAEVPWSEFHYQGKGSESKNRGLHTMETRAMFVMLCLMVCRKAVKTGAKRMAFNIIKALIGLCMLTTNHGMHCTVLGHDCDYHYRFLSFVSGCTDDLAYLFEFNRQAAATWEGLCQPGAWSQQHITSALSKASIFDVLFFALYCKCHRAGSSLWEDVATFMWPKLVWMCGSALEAYVQGLAGQDPKPQPLMKSKSGNLRRVPFINKMILLRRLKKSKSNRQKIMKTHTDLVGPGSDIVSHECVMECSAYLDKLQEVFKNCRHFAIHWDPSDYDTNTLVAVVWSYEAGENGMAAYLPNQDIGPVTTSEVDIEFKALSLKTRRRVARKHFSSRRKSECELSGKCVVRSVKSSELR